MLLTAPRASINNFVCKRFIKVLALEYSCDDSCVAILSSTGDILFNKKTTSRHVSEAGGVIPIKAINHHQKSLPGLVKAALEQTNMKLGKDITMICATRGPGLAGSLCAGYQFSKGLAVAHDNMKFVGVHHMLGHLLMITMEFEDLLNRSFLSLLVSGGHTQLVLSHDALKHDILIDLKEKRAIGDSLDKCGRLLGFKGNMIAKEMEDFISKQNLPLDDPEYKKSLLKSKFPFKFPLSSPKNSKDMAFSFSGQITQLKHYLEREKLEVEHLSAKSKAELAFQIQYLHFFHIIKKIKQLFAARPELAQLPIVISGGVASNSFLREYFREEFISRIYVPKNKDLCTDNAVMIGWAGLKFFEKSRLLTTLESTTKNTWLLSDLLTVDGYEKDPSL